MSDEYVIANKTDLVSIADSIRTKTGLNDELTFPNGFINAIDEISVGSSLIYGEIITSSNSTSITIPAIVGKTNVMLSYLGIATTSSSKAYVTCIDLQGDACSHNISYYNELYGTDDASLISYNSSTGTFALTSAYNEYFGAGKYTYVAW